MSEQPKSDLPQPETDLEEAGSSFLGLDVWKVYENWSQPGSPGTDSKGIGQQIREAVWTSGEQAKTQELLPDLDLQCETPARESAQLVEPGECTPGTSEDFLLAHPNLRPTAMRREQLTKFIAEDTGILAGLTASDENLRTDLEHAIRTNERMLSFESDLAAIDALPAEQRASIYASLGRILDGGGQNQLTELSNAKRSEIVRDLVHQIALPESIHQGNKDTCALASTEYELARNYPDIYARSVADWSTTGALSTPETNGGKSGQCEAGGSMPVEAVTRDDGSSVRSLASKIFQTGAANFALGNDRDTYESFKKEDAPPVATTRDTGERIVHENQAVSDWAGLTAPEQATLLTKLTGDSFESSWLRDMNKPADLQGKLESILADGRGPVYVSVDNGKHVVAVTGLDYTQNPPLVLFVDTARKGDAIRSESLKSFYGYSAKRVELPSGGYALTPPYVEVIQRSK